MTDTDNVWNEPVAWGLMEEDTGSHGQTPTAGIATESSTHLWSH